MKYFIDMTSSSKRSILIGSFELLGKISITEPLTAYCPFFTTKSALSYPELIKNFDNLLKSICWFFDISNVFSKIYFLSNKGWMIDDAVQARLTSSSINDLRVSIRLPKSDGSGEKLS